MNDDIRISRVVLNLSIRVIKASLQKGDMDTVHEILESLHKCVQEKPALKSEL